MNLNDHQAVVELLVKNILESTHQPEFLEQQIKQYRAELSLLAERREAHKTLKDAHEELVSAIVADYSKHLALSMDDGQRHRRLLYDYLTAHHELTIDECNIMDLEISKMQSMIEMHKAVLDKLRQTAPKTSNLVISTSKSGKSN